VPRAAITGSLLQPAAFAVGRRNAPHHDTCPATWPRPTARASTGEDAERLDRFALRYYRITKPTISFKVSVGAAARIRELARREGLSVSEFLRRRATAPVPSETAGAYQISEDPLTGLPVMRGPGTAEPVSSEQVRALMADFP